jgi:hypothetical protein
MQYFKFRIDTENARASARDHCFKFSYINAYFGSVSSEDM